MALRLSPNGSLSGASTVSPIFHVLEAFNPTLVLDEADFKFSDATADLAKILNKPAIVRWLKANQPDYLAEFQQIADLVSLNEAAPA